MNRLVPLVRVRCVSEALLIGCPAIIETIDSRPGLHLDPVVVVVPRAGFSSPKVGDSDGSDSNAGKVLGNVAAPREIVDRGSQRDSWNRGEAVSPPIGDAAEHLWTPAVAVLLLTGGPPIDASQASQACHQNGWRGRGARLAAGCWLVPIPSQIDDR